MLQKLSKRKTKYDEMQEEKTMKVKKTLRRGFGNRTAKKSQGPLAEFGMITFCAFLVLMLSVGSKVFGDSAKGQVYAASEDSGDFATFLEEEISLEEEKFSAGTEEEQEFLPKKEQAKNSEITIKRIGTSCEQVVVGQRVQTVQEDNVGLDVSASMENAVNRMDETITAMSAKAKLMSDEDYQTMLQIVEAEAGTEDIKGRVLVANVIMNRVNSEGFPNTVTEVVYEYENGVPQFSPVHDGRIYRVTVSDETREAVKLALEGVDYSEGALFFIMKSAAEEQGINWFEKELKYLFKHGVHEFYTYPEETEK